MRTTANLFTQVHRYLVGLAALGLYITLEGYHSREGDQAYRLPLLARLQSPKAYANDPFVNAVAEFHPHRGTLALLDFASRPFGLSVGLFVLFALVFLIAFDGFDRLARAIWPEKGRFVGVVAFGLLLACKAGNLGDNPLFEPLLLDRQIAFALGWLALALAIEGKNVWISPWLLALATFVHPSLGVQLAILWACGFIVWAILAKWTGISPRTAALACQTLEAFDSIWHETKGLKFPPRAALRRTSPRLLAHFSWSFLPHTAWPQGGVTCSIHHRDENLPSPSQIFL